MVNLVHELIFSAADHAPDTHALRYEEQILSYSELAEAIRNTAKGLRALGLNRGERVAVYLEKRLETVVALFSIAAAGGVFVPVNPVLKPDQVKHILLDCEVKMLLTSQQRWEGLQKVLHPWLFLRTIMLVDVHDSLTPVAGLLIEEWEDVIQMECAAAPMTVIDIDMTAILYTSGSTGKPKGVVFSHRNLVAGARSVCRYLGNSPQDRILTVLPLSFDYGLSQLTTAFYSRATNVLMNYLLPQDIIQLADELAITGLAAVPPLWIQLAQLKCEKMTSLRYLTNSGGVMPRTTLERLRSALPNTQIFLMYGFTEAFRSTYLAPEELDRRPNSIGKAIPNAEVWVVREDGSHCAPDEPGELVHRGALVTMGYWNDAVKTAQCFKSIHPVQGVSVSEIAAWSGDTVRMDHEGYLYFVERRDEMIKSSGYRISPTEIEEVIFSMENVVEVIAIGVSHAQMGQAIAVVVVAQKNHPLDVEVIRATCKQRLPTFMQPHHYEIRQENLPRNPNGKVDRKLLYHELQHLFGEHSE